MSVKLCVPGAFLGVFLFLFLAGCDSTAGTTEGKTPSPRFYVDPRDGNDYASGTAENAAFQTLTRAFLKAQISGIDTVVLMGAPKAELEIEANRTFRAPANTTSVFEFSNTAAPGSAAFAAAAREITVIGSGATRKTLRGIRGGGNDENNRRVMNIGVGVNVRFENVTITGGQALRGEGCAILVEEGGAVTLGENVLVEGNNVETATTEIVDNAEVITYTYSGSGILVKGGTLTLAGNVRITNSDEDKSKNNDIYLEEDNGIILKGVLNAADGPVALVTLAGKKPGYVFRGAVQSNYQKFRIRTGTDNVEYGPEYVAPTGWVSIQSSDEPTYYVDPVNGKDGSEAYPGTTAATAFKTLNWALYVMRQEENQVHRVELLSDPDPDGAEYQTGDAVWTVQGMGLNEITIAGRFTNDSTQRIRLRGFTGRPDDLRLRVLAVKSGSRVHLENLLITGGAANKQETNTGGYGGGILVENGAQLSLGNGVEIRGNTAPLRGNGIALMSGGTLLMGGSAKLHSTRNDRANTDDIYLAGYSQVSLVSPLTESRSAATISLEWERTALVLGGEVTAEDAQGRPNWEKFDLQVTDPRMVADYAFDRDGRVTLHYYVPSAKLNSSNRLHGIVNQPFSVTMEVAISYDSFIPGFGVGTPLEVTDWFGAAPIPGLNYSHPVTLTVARPPVSWLYGKILTLTLTGTPSGTEVPADAGRRSLWVPGKYLDYTADNGGLPCGDVYFVLAHLNVAITPVVFDITGIKYDTLDGAVYQQIALDVTGDAFTDGFLSASPWVLNKPAGVNEVVSRVSPSRVMITLQGVLAEGASPGYSNVQIKVPALSFSTFSGDYTIPETPGRRFLVKDSSLVFTAGTVDVSTGGSALDPYGNAVIMGIKNQPVNYILEIKLTNGEFTGYTTGDRFENKLSPALSATARYEMKALAAGGDRSILRLAVTGSAIEAFTRSSRLTIPAQMIKGRQNAYPLLVSGVIMFQIADESKADFDQDTLLDVKGAVGQTLSQDMLIRLAGDSFQNVSGALDVDRNLAAWFTDLVGNPVFGQPSGYNLQAKVLQTVQNGDEEIRLRVTGKPQGTYDQIQLLKVTIPRNALRLSTLDVQVGKGATQSENRYLSVDIIGEVKASVTPSRIVGSPGSPLAEQDIRISVYPDKFTSAFKAQSPDYQKSVITQWFSVASGSDQTIPLPQSITFRVAEVSDNTVRLTVYHPLSGGPQNPTPGVLRRILVPNNLLTNSTEPRETLQNLQVDIARVSIRATVNAPTINGFVNVENSIDAMITIHVDSDTFEDLDAYVDRSFWLVGSPSGGAPFHPAGISVYSPTPVVGINDEQEMYLRITGTPTSAMSGPIYISIPASTLKLNSASAEITMLLSDPGNAPVHWNVQPITATLTPPLDPALPRRGDTIIGPMEGIITIGGTIGQSLPRTLPQTDTDPYQGFILHLDSGLSFNLLSPPTVLLTEGDWFSSSLPTGISAWATREGPQDLRVFFTGIPATTIAGGSVSQRYITIPASFIQDAQTGTSLGTNNAHAFSFSITGTPSAAITSSPVTLDGVQGEAFTAKSFTVTLSNDAFFGFPGASTVVDWVTNLPPGLVARLTSPIPQGSLSAGIEVSDLGSHPADASGSPLIIRIPPEALLYSSENPITVTNPPGASFAITRNQVINVGGDGLTSALAQIADIQQNRDNRPGGIYTVRLSVDETITGSSSPVSDFRYHNLNYFPPGTPSKIVIEALSPVTITFNSIIGASSLLTVGPNLTLVLGNNVTWEGGGGNSASRGLFHVAGGDLKMTGGKIWKNHAGRGAGVFVESGTFTMDGGTISENEATSGGGGGVYVGGNARFVMNGGAISANRSIAANGGGGIYGEVVDPDYGSTSLPGAWITIGGASGTPVVSGNTALFGKGGGIYFNTRRDLTIGANASITNNTASQGGGGIFCFDANTPLSVPPSGTLIINGGSITANSLSSSTANGGGILSEVPVTMSGGIISGNVTSRFGGGIYSIAGFTMSGGTVGGIDFTPSSRADNNRAIRGGGIYADSGNISIGSGAKVQGNLAEEGGGIYAGGSATVVIQGTGEVGNNAAGSGGGIYFQSNGVISGGSGFILQNTGSVKSNAGGWTSSGWYLPENSGRRGGGIYLAMGSLTMSGNAAITGNTLTAADGDTFCQGGGMYAAGAGTAVLMNAGNISGNNARDGGGVALNDGAVFTLTDGSIGTLSSPNTASSRGGAFFVSGGAALIMSGGTISRNKADFFGGGVSLTGAMSRFTMNPGSVKALSLNNAASGKGGGIYADSGTVLINAANASIFGNTASYGGGVYLDGSAEANFQSGLIGTDTAAIANMNSAVVAGAGVYVNVDSGNGFRMPAVGGVFSGPGGIIRRNTLQIGAQGGGVYVNKGTFTLGGDYSGGGSITENGFWSGSTLTANAPRGGGVYVGAEGTFTMNHSNSNISKNQAAFGGGAAVVGGTFSLQLGTITGNTASDQGGALFLKDPGSSPPVVLMGGGEIGGALSGGNPGPSANKADAGGAVYLEGGTFSHTGGAIRGNEAAVRGGGVALSGGTYTMSNAAASITANKSSLGGAVSLTEKGSFFLINGTIGGSSASDGNVASHKGGALALVNVTVNTADTAYGFTMNGGAVKNNFVTGSVPADGGGAIYVNGPPDSGPILKSGLISSNRSASHGGAFYLEQGTVYLTGSSQLTSVSITGNTANLLGNGVYTTSSSSTIRFNGAYAAVNADNDIYLHLGASESHIKMGAVSLHYPVARVTPGGDYEADWAVPFKAVIKADNDQGVNVINSQVLGYNYRKFIVSPALNVDWFINNRGYLSQASEYYVSLKGFESDPSGDPVLQEFACVGMDITTPFKSLSAAVARSGGRAVKTISVLSDLDAVSEGTSAASVVFALTVGAGSSDPITLRGVDENGNNSLVRALNGKVNAAALSISGNTRLMFDHIKVTGGNLASGDGAGIALSGNAELTLGENSAVINNTGATRGSGIYVGGNASLILKDNAEVRGNGAFGSTLGGGIAVNTTGNVTITGNVTVADNRAGVGGAIYVEKGTVTQDGVTYEGNNSHTGVPESALYFTGSTSVVTMTGGTITSNGTDASAQTYAVSIRAGAAFTMTAGAISDNPYGGISVGPGNFTMSGNASVTRNGAGGVTSGGGIFVTGAAASGKTFTMNGGSVTQNSALERGGGIYVGGDGTVDLRGGTIAENSIASSASSDTPQGGGGVYFDTASSPSLVGAVTIADNRVSGLAGNTRFGGGGIYVNDTSSISIGAAFIRGNRVTSAQGRGGGIFVNRSTAGDTQVILIGTQVVNNTVKGSSAVATPGRGAGIYLAGPAGAALGSAQVSLGNQSRIAGNSQSDLNSAADFIRGGGIYVSPKTTAFLLVNSAVTGNTAFRGGGVYIEKGGGTLDHSGGFIADNLASDPVSSQGTGVYVEADALSSGVYKLSSYGRVRAGNDVYVTTAPSYSDLIPIRLTGSFPSTDVIATITPSTYSNNYVLRSDQSGLLPGAETRFAVTPQGGTVIWYVDVQGSGGYLMMATSGSTASVFYVDNTATSPFDGTEIHPYKTIGDAIKVIGTNDNLHQATIRLKSDLTSGGGGAGSDNVGSLAREGAAFCIDPRKTALSTVVGKEITIESSAGPTRKIQVGHAGSRVMAVAENTTVILKNVILEGGNGMPDLTGRAGGSVMVMNGARLVIGEGCVITNTWTQQSAAGISGVYGAVHVASGGEMVLMEGADSVTGILNGRGIVNSWKSNYGAFPNISGWAVSIASGGTLSFASSSARIDGDTPVFVESGGTVNLGNAVMHDPIAVIDPEHYTALTKVAETVNMESGDLGKNHLRFQVAENSDGAHPWWVVDKNGYLVQADTFYIGDDVDANLGAGDGLSPGRPLPSGADGLRNFALAVTMASADADVVNKTIVVNGTFASDLISFDFTGDPSLYIVNTPAAFNLTITGSDTPGPHGLSGAGSVSPHGVLEVTNASRVVIKNLRVSGGVAADGAGIRVLEGSTLTLGNGAAVADNNGGSGGGIRGGGVFVRGSASSTSTLVMEEGSTVAKNTAGIGGGIYLGENTMFTMRGGTIGGASGTDGNQAAIAGGVAVGEQGDMSVLSAGFAFTGGTIANNQASGDAGGLLVRRGMVTMNGSSASISANSAHGDGSALYLPGYYSTFLFNRGTISANKNLGVGHNGSVVLGGDGGSAMLIMNGGSITGNDTVAGDYSGLVLKSSNLHQVLANMTAGTISGNKRQSTADPVGLYGTGVRIAAGTATVFRMSAGAVVDTNNDVKLEANAAITLGGNFSGSDPQIRARITAPGISPPNTDLLITGTVVLKQGASDNYLVGNYSRFAVSTVPPSHTPSRVMGDGRVQRDVSVSGISYAAADTVLLYTISPLQGTFDMNAAAASGFINLGGGLAADAALLDFVNDRVLAFIFNTAHGAGTAPIITISQNAFNGDTGVVENVTRSSAFYPVISNPPAGYGKIRIILSGSNAFLKTAAADHFRVLGTGTGAQANRNLGIADLSLIELSYNGDGHAVILTLESPFRSTSTVAIFVDAAALRVGNTFLGSTATALP